jgi:predicted nucleic acid-binding protein
MKQAVYIETSVLSYLTSRPGKDLIVAARQALTRDWWDTQAKKYSLFVSAMVVQEAQAGDSKAAAMRLATLQGIPLLALTAEAEELAEALVRGVPIPRQYAADALHIAVATVHGVNYLMTWNFKHINNAQMKGRIARVAQEHGFEAPVICSPEELPGD